MVAILRRHALALFAALALAACGGGGGGGSSTPPPPSTQSFTDPNTYSTAATASLATPNENVSVTRAQLVLNGTTLAYTATAGHLTALAPGTRAPEASFFYVAYTVDGAAPGSRPVTFFYNGGPGSASVWLHLGSFGPKRIATNAPAHDGPLPFALVDNAESLLDTSDLVFVDAVGTGFSQAIAPNTNRTFWSVDSDAAVFRDFVARYVEVNNRGSSPKFLYGESYGGPRTAVLAALLEAAGITLRGVVLQSPALDYSSNCDLRELVASCSDYLPSYAATGSWAQLAVPSPPPAQIPAHMSLMREFATNFYAPAVQTYIATRQLPGDSIILQLQDFTGMSRVSWQAAFNPGPTRFRTTLLPGRLFGRYDARVASNAVSASNGDSDPSSTAISPSFAARIGEHLSANLRFTTPSVYVTLSNAIETWDFRHAGRGVPDTVPDLAAAIAINPNLKVLAMNGYHDLATPFFTTEHDLARLGANPNVSVRNYVGGHMTYLDDAARARQKADLVEFYRSATR